MSQHPALCVLTGAWLLMVIFGILFLILIIGLKSSQISSLILNRIAIIVLLLSGVLAQQICCMGQLGSGVGIFNGLFQVTPLTQGMDLFIYIVGILVLLMSETQVNNSLQINKEELALKGSKPYSITGVVGVMLSSLPMIREYPIVVLLSVLGMTLLISSYDLLSMFLALELQSLALYVMAVVYKDSESAASAGLKYFILGSLSSAIILLGSGLVYGYTGLTSFEGLYMLCSTTVTNKYIEFSVLLIIAGLLFKVAAAPFHNWSIDVYDGVPSLVTAWLTTMPKISLLLFILEFQGFAFLSNWSTWTLVLSISTILSIIFGSLGGLTQYRIKRLLAYSTISHVGFILFALSINTINSVEAFLFYLIQYSLTNVNVFSIVIAFGYLLPMASIYSPVQLISQLKGQITANLVLSLSLAICLFSLMGIPPIIGFFAKIMVLMAALYNGYYFLSIVAILFSVVSAVYYLIIIKVVNFDKYTPDIRNNPNDNNLSYLANNLSYPGYISFVSSITIAVLTLLIIIFILNPNLLLHSLHHLALSLFTV